MYYNKVMPIGVMSSAVVPVLDAASFILWNDIHIHDMMLETGWIKTFYKWMMQKQILPVGPKTLRDGFRLTPSPVKPRDADLNFIHF